MMARREARVVGLLSLVGIVDGVYALLPVHSVAGEFTFWVLAGVLWGIVVVREGLERKLVALVAVGALAGFWTALVEGVFWDAYLANIPSVAEAYEGMATPLAILVNFVQTSAVGAVWGALVWVIVWVWGRWIIREERTSA